MLYYKRASLLLLLMIISLDSNTWINVLNINTKRVNPYSFSILASADFRQDYYHFNIHYSSYNQTDDEETVSNSILPEERPLYSMTESIINGSYGTGAENNTTGSSKSESESILAHAIFLGSFTLIGIIFTAAFIQMVVSPNLFITPAEMSEYPSN